MQEARLARTLGCRLIMAQPESDGGELCHGEESGSMSIVTGCDVPELLEFVDASLDEISAFVFSFTEPQSVHPV